MDFSSLTKKEKYTNTTTSIQTTNPTSVTKMGKKWVSINILCTIIEHQKQTPIKMSIILVRFENHKTKEGLIISL